MGLRWTINIALFLGAFALTADLIRGDRSWGMVPEIAAKAQHARTATPSYDTVFIGSSRVHRGVVPEVFDEEMARLGHPSRTYNMAWSGTHPHEANVRLRHLLADPPPRLRRVFLEMVDWDPTVDATNEITQRVIGWHETAEIWGILSSQWRDSGRSGYDLISQLRIHTEHFLAYWSNVGAGPRVWRWLFYPAPAGQRPKARAAKEHGYLAARASDARFVQSRKSFLTSLPKYRAMRAARMAGTEERTAFANRESIRAQVRLCAEHDVELVYFVPPTLRPIPPLDDLFGDGPVAPILRFDSPSTDPDLFLVANRYDRDHLNRVGASAFSKRLAARYAARKN